MAVNFADPAPADGYPPADDGQPHPDGVSFDPNAPGGDAGPPGKQKKTKKNKKAERKAQQEAQAAALTDQAVTDLDAMKRAADDATLGRAPSPGPVAPPPGQFADGTGDGGMTAGINVTIDPDLIKIEDDSQKKIGIQLEVMLESLEGQLDMTIEERTKLAHELNTLQQEIAVLDGETVSRTAEIRERERNLVEVNDIINNLKNKACAYALETKQIAEDVQGRIAMDPKDKALMEGKNRLERVRGALLDLYAEQLVLKASFLAYAGSIKGVSKKTRITKDLNEQTHQMMKDIPPLKQDIMTLRDKLTAFKRDTAEASVRLRDQIQQEREQMITEAREQKYLVKLYEEEAKIMERLDSDLRLQLDSAVEVAGKLQLELRDNQAYFDHLTSRLQFCIHHEKMTVGGGMASILSRKKKTTSPVEAKPGETATATKVDETTVITITAQQPKKEEEKGKTMLIGKGNKKAADLQDLLNDMDLKRGAMRAQIKYLEHKIQQLEIEVYISKMNVEIQMLQTSIKIETWKKTGKVPAALTVSAIDTSLKVQGMPAPGSPSVHSPHDHPLETRHRVKRGSVGQDIIGATKDSIVKGPKGVFGKTVDMARGDKRM